MDPRTTFGTANDLTDALGATGYLADDALATSPASRCASAGRCCWRASRAPARPPWPRRSPRRMDLPLIRLQCYEGIDATQALYDWDFPRQILHLRALEAVEGAARDVARGRAGPLRRALPPRPARAAGPARRPGRAAHRRDRPGRRRVRGVPARGALDLAGDHPRARHRHGGRRRRSSCSPPTAPASCTTRSSAAASTTGSTTPASTRELAIVAQPRCPRCRPRSPSRSSRAVHGIRADREMLKPPGVAETLDWARALHELGARELDTETAAATLGVAVKYREDAERVKKAARRDADPMTVRDHVRARAARGAAPRLRPRPARGRGRRHRRPRAHLPRGGRGRRARRPAGGLLGRPRHAVRLTGRPRALRPRLRRVVQRPAGRHRRTAPRCPTSCAQAGLGVTEGAGRRRAPTTRMSFAPRPARPRCCGTATSPPSPAASASRWPPCSARLRPRAPRRRAHRYTASRRGAVDARATLRSTLRRMGEPGEVALAPPRHPGRARSCCSSTSRVDERLRRRAPPARARLLRAPACRSRCSRSAPGSPTSPGRCTSATPTARIVAAGDAVPDWSGGTRLGEARQGLPRPLGAAGHGARRGRRRLQRRLGARRARGCSASRCAGCARLAHRVVWVNPHRGKAGYEPVQRGIVAALPHVDDFVAGHSLAAFEELTEVVARA